MNNLATVAITNLFAVAAKGTDNTATSEVIDPGANDFTQAGTTLTSTGARTFVAGGLGVGDEGKRYKAVNTGEEATILSVTSPTTAEVDTTHTIPVGKDLVLWHVNQIGLFAETNVEAAGGSGTLTSKTLGSNVITTSGNFNVHTTVVGRSLYFPSQQRSFLITAYDAGASTVTITITGDDFAAVSESGVLLHAAVTASDGTLRSASRTNVYSGSSADNGVTWSGEVTGVGAHPDHIKTLTRTFIFDPNPALGLGTSETIREVGFSHLTTPGNNLNIRVKLATPVVILGPVGANPGQQLRVQYEMVVTFPFVISGTVSCPITDAALAMSANKNGKYAIEGPQISGVATDGDPVLVDPVLDPYYAPVVAFSSNADPLAPLAFPIRPPTFTTETVVDGTYLAGSFEQVFVAQFGVNEAIATNLRSLMLFIPTSGTAAFTFLFNSNQTKDALHVLIVRFTKTWSRDLSP